MKVLVSAYACEPSRGSEPGAGWTWARAAAMRHDVWVLTRANNAEAIEAALRKEPHLRLTPVYLDLDSRWRFWKRGSRGVHAYYILWQWLARRTARELHAKHRFDVAHHLTFAVDWMPAAAIGIDTLPSVWGPVGGTEDMPWSLWRWLGWRGLAAEVNRAAWTRVLRRLFGDAVARRSDLVVAQNREVARRFSCARRVLIEPNPALDEPALPRIDRAPRLGSRRAVFVGRLVPLKGLRLAIAAVAEPQAAGWRLDIIGDGPERKPAYRLARRLGVADRIRFLGELPRSQALACIAAADAVLLPSMHDAAGWAVAEANALGTPVVCLDRGGPPLLIAENGFPVSPRGRQTPRLLAQALDQAPGPQPPSRRWSAGRLPDLLDGWYKSTVDSRIGSQ